jgi:hypothetical protein
MALMSEHAFTNDQLVAGIADATGVDIPRARFMLGLQQGQTAGDVAVVGGAHVDRPLVELSSIAANIVRTEGGAFVALIADDLAGSVVWTEGVLATTP